MATAEEHDDAIIVNAHDAEVLVLFLTMTLRFTNICAGCNLQQHVASHLHDLGSRPEGVPCEGTYGQSAGRSISKYAGAPAALLKDGLA